VSRIEVSADFGAVQRLAAERGWGDGLPVVPPTEELVAAMLGGADPAHAVGSVPPGYGEATLEVLAANAVMAGCEPRAFPVVVAAVRALLEPPFNLAGVQATTHPVAPLLVVHGPVAAELGLNGGSGVLGPGFAANATLGRAIRLILMNVGLARPGNGDLSTHGGPAKYCYCMTENAAESPWPEYHTTAGFAASDSAVTVIGLEAPHNVQDHQSTTGERLASILADAMRQLGHNSWVISKGNDYAVLLGPEHARMLAGDGWSREDVQRYLYHRASRPVADVMRAGNWANHDWPVWMNALAADPANLVPPVRRPEEIRVLVAGGPGKHSAVMPGFGSTSAVTRRVEPVAPTIET
jgi:hypothetical protein